jgi:hypothetical protein
MVLTLEEKFFQNLETCSIIINGKNTHSNWKLISKIIHLILSEKNNIFKRENEKMIENILSEN